MDDTPKKAKNAGPGNEAPAAARRPARAELVWEGKYDAAGRRVAPLRVALPFQTVETVNESAQDRQSNLQFGPGFREEEWRNRLIWGDKKYVLPSLLPEFAGRVNLIYIDPPFDTGGFADYHVPEMTKCMVHSLSGISVIFSHRILPQPPATVQEDRYGQRQKFERSLMSSYRACSSRNRRHALKSRS